MLVEKPLNIGLCQVANSKVASMRPAREVRDTTEVYAGALISVALINKTTPIRGNEWGNVTVTQPRGWNVVDRSEGIHKVS